MQPNLSLDPSEWRAVAIALSDATRAACTPSRTSWVCRLYVALTGNEPSPPLADRRLEAIRSFVVASRRLHRPAEPYIPALVEQGFNCRQIQALALLAA